MERRGEVELGARERGIWQGERGHRDREVHGDTGTRGSGRE